MIIHKVSYITSFRVGGQIEKVVYSTYWRERLSCNIAVGNMLVYCFAKNKLIFWPIEACFLSHNNFQINLLGNYIFICLAQSLPLFRKFIDILNNNTNVV